MFNKKEINDLAVKPFRFDLYWVSVRGGIHLINVL